MANRQIGEVELKTDSGTYRLRFGAYSLAELETELDRTMLSIAEELIIPEKRRIKTVIAALWAGLQEHQPGMDMRGAAKIMDEMGFVEAGMKVAEAMNLAFPEQEGAAGNGTANPPNRKARRAAAAKRG